MRIVQAAASSNGEKTRHRATPYHQVRASVTRHNPLAIKLSHPFSLSGSTAASTLGGSRVELELYQCLALRRISPCYMLLPPYLALPATLPATLPAADLPP